MLMWSMPSQEGAVGWREGISQTCFTTELPFSEEIMLIIISVPSNSFDYMVSH